MDEDKLKEIKNLPILQDIFLGATVTLMKEERDYLVLEIERLEKEKEWLIKDYAKYMKMKSFRYCILNIEKAEEDLRETLKEAMDKK